jgi:hypothetical protein
LSDALRRLNETFHAAVFLDRRVDPTRRINLDAQDANLAHSLQLLANAAELGGSQIGNVTYLGPRSTAEQLRTIAEVHSDEANRLPAGDRAPLLQKRPLEWPRLTEPRALVSDSVSSRGWRLAGSELIPHDLWPAGRLPAAPLAEQLTVLLAGFDLSYRVLGSQRTIEIVPLERSATLSRRYRLRYGAEDLKRIQQQFPGLRMQLQGEFVSVDGGLKEHQALAEWLIGPKSQPVSRPPTGAAKQVYTLHVEEQPLKAVIDTLAAKLKWQLEVDEAAIRAAGKSLDQRVSFEVTNADQDELLRAMLRPAGLDFRREGERIQIVPLKGAD